MMAIICIQHSDVFPLFPCLTVYYHLAKERGLSLEEAKETFTNPSKKLVTADQVLMFNMIDRVLTILNFL